MLYNDVCEIYILRFDPSLQLMMSLSYVDSHNKTRTANFLSFRLSLLRLQKTCTAYTHQHDEPQTTEHLTF